MQRINSHLHSKRIPPYVLNLDPAVRSVPFHCNIDIRESVDYKEVMKQYNLGPNGGILTSLNLFTTKVDQIIGHVEKRISPPPDSNAVAIKRVIIDTPGQIEVFVWSASGMILLDSFASALPTVIAYIIDTPKSSSTSTFMSNMLYACSILYKTKLPMILVFNKADVQDPSFATEWMTDFEAFQAALRAEEEAGGFGGFGEGGSGYLSSLLHSMSLVRDEFYRHLKVVGVRSMTGQGVDEFFEAVTEKAAEFERDYKPELERRQRERQEEKEKQKDQELSKVLKDMNVSGASMSQAPKPGNGATLSDMEDDDQENEDDEDDMDTEDDSDEARGGTEGLQARYKRAMDDQLNKKGETRDPSFAKHIAEGNIG